MERSRRDVRPRASAPDALAVWAVAVVVGAIVLAIGTPLLGLTSLHASDVLQVWAPWADDAPHDYQPQNGVVTDTVNAVTPARAEFRQRVHDGDFPLWASEPAGGSPHGANPNTATLSPFTWLYLVVPLWYAPALVKLAEMVVAAGFTFLLARQLRLGRAAASAAALVYVLSGFQVAYTNWPQAQVAALIPALFWALERAIDRGRAVDAWPAALVSAVMWLAGFPAVTLWAHATAVVFVLVRVVAARRARERDPEPPPSTPQGLGTVGVLLLGAAVAAVQLVPFAARFLRADLSYRADKDVGALPWETLITLVAPNAFGSPTAPDPVYFGPVHYVEMQAFLGATALLLVALAAVAGRRVLLAAGTRTFLWATAAICALLIYVGGPLLTLHQAVPIVGTNQIGRLRSVLVFVLALLAGIGFQALVDRALLGRHRVVLTVGALVVAGTVALAWPAWQAADAAAATGALRTHLVRVALAAGMGALAMAVGAAADRTSLHAAALGVVLLVVAIESVGFARSFWPRIPVELFYPRTAAHDLVAAELGSDRLAAEGDTFYPGTASLYDLRSVTAHVLTPEPYAELLETAQPDVFRFNRTYPRLAALPDVMTSPILDRLGATLFAAPPAAPVPGEVDLIGRADAVTTVPAGEAVEVAIPAGPLRALRLTYRGPSAPAAATWLTVEVRDDAGDVVAEGRRRVSPRDPAGDFDVAVLPTRDWPATGGGTWTAAVGVDAAAGSVDVGAIASGAPSVSVIAPVDDDLELIATDGVNLYRRTTALPRIRWAAQAEVIPDAAARLGALAGGVPPDRVVLSEDPGASDGGAARLEVLDDGGDRIEVRVAADGPGYLVVADSIQEGWHARVAGEDVPLLDADHAFGAVHVPAGEHDVELRYVPPGLRAGLVVSLVALAGVAVLAVRSVRLSRRTRPPRAPAR